MRKFDYMNAYSMTELCSFMSEYGANAKILAGGTDLLTVLKADICPNYPEKVINIKGIDYLNKIEEREDNLSVRSLATLKSISESSVVRKYCKMLSFAADRVASPQIRNIATIGGNICQETRCWYFRSPEKLGGMIMCARKGGKLCYAVKGNNRYHCIIGGKRCFAVCPSDTIVALAAMDAKIHIMSSEGERTVTAEEFFTPMGNVLSDREILSEVEIPISRIPNGQAFVKFSHRNSIDFAVSSAAVKIEMDRNVCSAISIAAGAIAPGPVRIREAEEKLIGSKLSEKDITEAVNASLSNARPFVDNGYKVALARGVIKEAIYAAKEDIKQAINS